MPHFRTSALREVGGWDAYNVTEDADLGFRLGRFGYRSVTFESTTSEEAPFRFEPWLRQRSRWMKGWMQTWLVHMREPRRLWRELGARGFFALNILIGGSVLTALAFPILILEILLYLTVGAWPPPLHLVTTGAGLFSAIAIGLVGLARRDRLRDGWIQVWTIPYWAFLSIAAWRALIQLWRNPYHWEKTEHGLAKRSQSGIRPPPTAILTIGAPQRRFYR